MSAALFNLDDDGTLDILISRANIKKITRVTVAEPGRRTSKVFLPENKEPESKPLLTYNENISYTDCDEFICHKCGIHIEDWNRVKTDDDGQEQRYEYTFKHCPECGAKIIEHRSCEFCRWHLNNGICFRPESKKHNTSPENDCWWWEEHE